jgi:EAL domain-containing protein (putative c-di-GMP-specific phosphodiesterase class I)
VAISRLMLLKFELTESVLLGDVEAALETIKTLKVTGGAMQWMLSVRVVPQCPA